MSHYFEIIKKQLKYHFPKLRKDFQIKEIGVFGSVAKGLEKEKSDVDILVDFSHAPGFFGFVRLEQHLSDILHRKVDLVTKKALKDAIKEQILRQVIYV